jgi:hypothetical protein
MKIVHKTFGILVLLLVIITINYGARGCVWESTNDTLTLGSSGHKHTITFDAPSNLRAVITATDTTTWEAGLAWQNNADDAVGFEIQRRSELETSYILINTVSAITLTYSDTISPDLTYTYRVRAYKGSTYSSYASVVLLMAPSNLTYIITPTDSTSCQVGLEWRDNADSAFGFAIERSSEQEVIPVTYAQIALVNAGATTLTYADTIVPGRAYTYRIRAYSTGTQSFYDSVTMLNAPVDLILNITTTDSTSCQVDLGWNVVTTDSAAGFKIERNSDLEITYTQIAIVPAGTITLTYTDTVSPDLIYNYRIRAYQGVTESSYNYVSILKAPSNLTYIITPTDSTSCEVGLRWRDNSDNAEGFEIQRIANSEITYTRIALVNAGPVTLTYTDTITPEITYTYRVRAYMGYSHSVYDYVSLLSPPLSPTIYLTPTDVTSCQVELEWFDNTTNTVWFEIERNSELSPDYVQIAIVAAGSITLTCFDTISPDLVYNYRIRAYRGGTYSDYSTYTYTGIPIPGAPSNLTASLRVPGILNGIVDLQWDAILDSADEFEIERNTSLVITYTQIAIVPAGTITLTYSDAISPDIAYNYRVRASYKGCEHSSYVYSGDVWENTAPNSEEVSLLGRGISGQIALQTVITWRDTLIDETGYTVERKTWSLGTYNTVTLVVSTAITYGNIITYTNTVSPATTYYYRIRGYKGAVTGTDSSVLSIDTPVDMGGIGGDVGKYVSMRIGTDGKIHMAYYDATNSDLKYATISPTVYGSIVTTKTVISNGNLGEYCSLVISSTGVNNTPYITYYDNTNSCLAYAWLSGATWITNTIDTAGNVGSYSSLAIDNNWHLHVSYYDITKHDLKYATNTTGTWVTLTVDEPPPTDTNYTGKYSSIAVTSDKTVYISYWDETHNSLKYATISSFNVTSKTIDTNAGAGTAIVTEDDGSNIHILYSSAGGLGVTCARIYAGQTTLDPFDEALSGGTFGLTLDSSNNVYVTYYWALNTLRTAYKPALGGFGTWVADNIYTTGNVGKYSSIRIDASNKKHVVFYDLTNKCLRYYTDAR